MHSPEPQDPYRTVSTGISSVPASAAAQPERIGRYRVDSVLGKGGFGLVYLGHDEQLGRRVAIKVPHKKLIAGPEDAEAYLLEARTVAGLDHPHIVPVYDVGSTADYPCFVVSKLIEGGTLAARIKQARPPVQQALEWVATSAEALHYAHRMGLVHRDVKPGNILLDGTAKPFLADFGLALREQSAGQGPRYIGTPAYMSPEQARGEGHRVDGRSDVFSLGVVLYELLTGRRPFAGETRDELLEQIATLDPRPVRQWDDAVPKEVERICLKALAKRAADRWTTAKDMADDLRHFLADVAESGAALVAPATPVAPNPPAPIPASTVAAADTPASDSRPIKIVPKGLRSFDAHDADFFLELLPGPRDRDGLPDSIRFWKTRIEETDADSTFAVGLIYGPSGCGKSSLVKAGLLPRLADSVIAVYVEATADETETRLLNGLRKRCPNLSATLNLKDTLAALRVGQAFQPARKLLIVLDQFEQWLHARKDEDDTELVQALRQCDGARLQCVVMVRDDFWMATTRFVRALEVRLVDGQNSAAVDLFPLRHAEKVLAAFGRAFGALPEAESLGRRNQSPSTQLLQPMADRLDHLPDQFRELREGMRMAIAVADVDPEMALTRGRKVLEFVVRDVYERRVAEPPGTRPLENLLQRIVKDGYFPDRLDAYANTIRKLGNVGAHSYGAQVTAADVHQSLTQLMLVLEWYLEIEREESIGQRSDRMLPPEVAAHGPGHADPDHPRNAGGDQRQFLEQAVRGLSQENKVICVRLALFAQMMKGRPWTPATLQEVGGAEGIGATFLEETFSAAGAPPEHLYHQKAARAVLKALLPESGTDIKGHMRSQAELLAASGYAARPSDFDDVMRLLDGEVRLITPTDPDGNDDASAGRQPPDLSPHQGADAPRSPANAKYYQLTHDYLVPSLRDWLTRKQKETRRGRAELLLADRAAVWNARTENRQLPSLSQWTSIRVLTRKKTWTPPQRKMMRKATRYHIARALVVAVLLTASAWTGFAFWSQVEEDRNRTHAAGLVKGLLNAEMGQVPSLLNEIDAYRAWAEPLLRQEYDSAPPESPQKLRAALALLRHDPAYRDHVYRRLLDATPQDIKVVRHELRGYAEALSDGLWHAVDRRRPDKPGQRLCAACALAAFDPSSKAKWHKDAAPVAEDLLAAALMNPSHYPVFLELLQPVGAALVDPLTAVFRNPERSQAERTLATSLLAEFAAKDLGTLANLLMDADAKQFAVLYPGVKQHGTPAVAALAAEIDKRLVAIIGDDGKDKLAKRQANAAVALLKMDRPDKVWPLLKHSPDPRVRSYLIHRLQPLGADARAIIARLDEEPDITIRRALLLSLGEYSEKEFSPEYYKALLPKLQDIYRNDADPGLHAAAEWLLRTWKREAWLKRRNDDWAKGQVVAGDGCWMEGRKAPSSAVRHSPIATRRWYVNGQSQTMVVIPGPVEFVMGSPATEAGRQDNEPLHEKRIGRTFAIAAKSVTVEQYRKFDKGYQLPPKYTRMAELPVVGTSWDDAAAYCNWLSKEEAIPEDQWCYETDAKGQITKLSANYLRLAGYRLPTEAELEYATRAGALTSRYYGETEELLPKYAWYVKNSQEQMWPVGSLKPNDFGLFDVQGNVFTWCQENYGAYLSKAKGEAVDDKEYNLGINTGSRVVRGGAFDYPAPYVRSAYRSGYAPATRDDDDGFRLARTVIP